MSDYYEILRQRIAEGRAYVATEALPEGFTDPKHLIDRLTTTLELAAGHIKFLRGIK